jgi:HSF-type DNA-binding
MVRLNLDSYEFLSTSHMMNSVLIFVAYSPHFIFPGLTVQYDFRKTVQDPNHGEFQHPNFRQDRPELLPNIKRKAHHKSSESSKKSLGALLSEASEYSG